MSDAPQFIPIRFRNAEDMAIAVEYCQNNKAIPRHKILLPEDPEYKDAHIQMSFDVANRVLTNA